MSSLPEVLESPAVDRDLAGRLRRFIELKRQKSDLQSQVDALTAQLRAIEEPLLEDMALAGMQNSTIDGHVVYRTTSVYAGIKDSVDRSEFIRVMRETGHEGILTANYQSLSALAREYRDRGEPLPLELSEVVEVREVVGLRTRKA